MGVAMTNTPLGRRGEHTSIILSQIRTLRCGNWGCYIDHARFFNSVKQTVSQNTSGIWGAGVLLQIIEYLFSVRLQVRGLACAAGAPARGALLAEGRCCAEIIQ